MIKHQLKEQLLIKTIKTYHIDIVWDYGWINI
jgi:hypothetical protein